MARIKFVRILALVIFLFLGIMLIKLQLIQGKKFKALSDKNCIRLIPQLGCRGKILDRSGRILVTNRLSYDLMVMPEDLQEREKVFAGVAPVLGTGIKALRDASKRNFVSSSLPVTLAVNLDLNKAIALEELKVDIPGIIIQPRPLREYPFAGLACHVLGYLGEIDRWRLTRLEPYGYKTRDIVGFGGVEEKYDYYLRQEEGGLSIEVDHRGRLTRVLGFRPPVNGKDIKLTIDLDLQRIAEKGLGGKRGSVVIIEPHSGQVLAMASSPGYSPEAFVEKSQSMLISLFQDADAPLLNRAISGLYPPGSIFKTVVACAALESGKINLGTSFYCSGALRVGKKEFKCWSVHHDQDLNAAIAHSCNVFFYRTGLLIGPALIHDYALKFGLGKTAAFDLPYESGGNIPSAFRKKIYKFQNWFDGDTANFSIGQGECLVTPLSMARLVSVFANGGFLVTPHITKEIAGKDISARQKKKVNLRLRKSTLEALRQGMRFAVLSPKGTANVLSGLPVPVAGKTGTAQAASGQPHAWFVGFFPFDNPKYAICVLLEHGGPGYYSCVAAKQMIEQMFQEGLI